MKKLNVMRYWNAIGLAMVMLFAGCEDAFFSERESSAAVPGPGPGGDLPLGWLTGFQGFTYERLPDNSIGPKIPWVKITFTKEDGSLTETVYSDANGFYKIDLPAGRYYTVAIHPNFEIYNSSPGFFVVTGTDGFQTGNFFLKELTYGRQGHTYVRNWDGSIGPLLPFVKLTFTKDDGLITKVLWSDANGHYKVSLPIGKYYTKAEKSNYITYSSAPGVSVVTGVGGYTTLNFFQKPELILVPL